MTADAVEQPSASDAKRSAVRAIRALAEVINHIDQGDWLVVVRDDLPHIEANVAHIRVLGTKEALR